MITIHDRCAAWRSQTILGAFTISKELAFPEKMIRANYINKNADYETRMKTLGQIRWLNKLELMAQKSMSSMYKCAIYCYHIDNWCKSDAVGTIRFSWLDEEIEQYYCMEHIRNHCRNIRKSYPQAFCYCCLDKDPLKTCTS